MMGSIYRASERLIVWLGHFLGEEEDSKFMEVLKNYGCETPDYPASGAHDSDQLMTRFLERAWFSRRWAIQEVVTTRQDRRWFFFGQHAIAYSDL